jgi:hypothetical protein
MRKYPLFLKICFEWIQKKGGLTMIKKKVVKSLFVIFIIVGIVFSMSNFFSIELRAGKDGDWEYNQHGDRECVQPGDKCLSGGAFEP